MGPCIVIIFQYISNKMQRYTVYFIRKLLYMFRVVPPAIIRTANNCIYSIWYLSHRYCYLPLSWKSWNWLECAAGGIPDAVDTVVCAPDDGWWYHPKHVKQFPDKINCVTLHLVGYTKVVWKVLGLTMKKTEFVISKLFLFFNIISLKTIHLFQRWSSTIIPSL